MCLVSVLYVHHDFLQPSEKGPAPKRAQLVKCQLILSPDAAPNVDMLLFPSGLPVVATRCFELLGAPIGPDAFCQHYSSQTVDKATACLDAVAAVPDPQTALLLLRHCVSYTKLTYSMRVTPPAMHAQALQAFDDRVRACLEQLGGLPLTIAAWEQACLGVALGGLGLRSAAHHAPAAFLASASATATHCQGLDPQYVLAWPVLTDATSRYNLAVPAHDQFSQPCTQQHLSACLDKARLSSLLDAASCESARAHLRLLQQARAGSWLHARPCEALGLHIEPHLFRVLLRLRLRLPVASSDGFCPLCDGTADRFGDHARTCPCGGDRCKRHNRLRSVLAAKAGAAGLSPEVEKENLLPARPEKSGGCEAGAAGRQASARRPADVYVPIWGLHDPATGGLRAAVLAASAVDGASAVAAYEDRKRQYQATAAQCRAQGLQFLPLVAEACGGGWGAEAVKVWKSLAALLAGRAGLTPAQEQDQLFQLLSVTMQRENARAVFRRLPSDTTTVPVLPHC